MPHLLFLSAVLFAISGCANLTGGTDRIREGNRVISESYPSATFAVSDEFDFHITDSAAEDAQTAASSTDRSKFKDERFVFVKPQGRNAQKVAVIQFHTLMQPRWTWERGSEWSGPGVVYSSRDTEIGEMETWATFANSEETLTYFGIDLSGFRYEPCAIVVTARRIPQAMRRYKQLIHYIEPIGCARFDEFAYSSGALNNNGRLRLERTLQNAFTDIRVFANE